MVAAKHGYILFNSLLEVRTQETGAIGKRLQTIFFKDKSAHTQHMAPLAGCCSGGPKGSQCSAQQPWSPPVTLPQRWRGGMSSRPTAPFPFSTQLCPTVSQAQFRHLVFKIKVLAGFDQAAHRALHSSYTRHLLHRVRVTLDRALIFHPNNPFCVAEKQPAWADQRSHSQTRHALLAHRHSHPWAATGAAGLPLQEGQH